MVLNYYDEDTYGQLITKAGEDFYSINFYKVCQFSKLPSVIFQNTPIDVLHKNPGLFLIAVKEGDTETVEIFLNKVDRIRLKADESFGFSLDNRTLQVTKLLLDHFPISDFKISTHLIKVIKAGKHECFELILQNVNIDLLDIDELLKEIIINGKCKLLLLDVLQRNMSKLNIQSKCQDKLFLALQIEDLEVFEFLLRNVDHENIDAKYLVIEAEILISATKDGDVSIINDIIIKRDEDFKFNSRKYIEIAIQHRQPIAVKIFVEHSSYICNLDVKLEFIAFAEKGKTRICELYLEVIDTYNKSFTLTPGKTPVMSSHIMRLFDYSFTDDHIEHQLMSRLHLMDLLDLPALFENAFLSLFNVNETSRIKCASMILINFGEDVVDRLITIGRFNDFELNDIFFHVCHECREGKEFIATISKLERRYGNIMEDRPTNEVCVASF
ncbi:unnamed protein product [Mytilus edulis]|uniref:Uncharacterized protein n=1 Tax=Mytilus edulis TaxID=6550 RepID=A0A8S3R0T6_MYTED|nr:unnamed protein product [Mytilus edulis]